MKLERVHREVDGIPHMNVAQAGVMTRFINEHQVERILELGFQHGVSTCYMAGALDERGRGKITTIDLVTARENEPNVETLLDRCGLQHYAEVYYEPTSYTWRLMKMLEEDPRPRFDLCYLDGAHSWFVDGFTFFLVDRLLRPGGWIIFDDLDWSYASSPALKQTPEVMAMSKEEQETEQVRKVYELLVKPHPSYGDFLVDGSWAYAHKLTSDSGRDGISEVRTETVLEDRYVGIGGAALTLAKKIGRRGR